MPRPDPDYEFQDVILQFIIMPLVKRLILPRRDLLVRRGRQIQTLLRVPESVHIFAATDPGILEEDLQTAAELLLVAALFALPSTLMLLYALCSVSLSHKQRVRLAVSGISFLIPTFSIVICAWVILVFARRRLVAKKFEGGVRYRCEKAMQPSPAGPQSIQMHHLRESPADCEKRDCLVQF